MQFDHEFEVIYPSTTGIDSLTIGGTGSPGALNLPTGTTATRTTAPVAGSLRFNTTLVAPEFYNGTTWGSPLVLTSQAAGTVLAAPVSAAGLPTFRLQALGEHSDVTLTSPATSQVLLYNGSQWINSNVLAGNAAGLVGVSFSSGGTAWTQVGSTTRYTATFTHGLGTQNVVITVFNSADNSVVIPDKVVATDANTVTITVVGNTLTLKVVVVANGSSVVANGSTPSSIVTAFNGVTVTAAATKINFVGSTVVADAGSGTTTVSIGARFTNYANSFDTPNNSDWALNAFAPVVTDPSFPAMNVRQFSATVEQGVGFMATIPTGATNVTFRLRGRPATAPGAASTVQMRIYWRSIPNNGAVGAWVGPFDLTAIAIPTNANFQYFIESAPLAYAGLVAGTTYQFEVTRKVIGTYTGNFLLAESTFEFA